MYFQKPADALTATGGPGASADGVAQLNGPGAPALPVAAPDALVPPLPPPPPAARYLPGDKPLTPTLPQPVLNARPVPPVATTVYTQPQGQPQKDEHTAQKEEYKVPPVDPKYVQLPPRESIFIVYNDAELEREIMKRLREELKNQGKGVQEEYLVFPPLPIVSPPGVPYQPKTLAYEPRKLIIEPGYVVHRRLYFEEKNAERIGWDFGPMQTLVSAAYFWKDTLSIAHTAASGCVYGFWDTSAGKCLPGSPSPYYLYPPGLTVTGSLTEGAVLTGLGFIFP
jgi:hypothetical protein